MTPTRTGPRTGPVRAPSHRQGTPMIDRFEAAFGRLNTAIAACVALSIAAFTILTPLDFALRKLRWGSFEWLNETAEYGLFFGVFLAATWVLQKGAHVRVDIVLALLPSRGAARLERAMDLAGAALCLAMAWFGVQGGWGAYLLGTLPDKHVQIPNWVVLAVFSVSFLFLAIEFLLRFRRTGQRGYEAAAGVGI